MHKNIFLASYPKSGNTWLRSIIGNFYNFDKEFSLNDLKSIPLLSIKKHLSAFDNKVYINNNELHLHNPPGVYLIDIYHNQNKIFNQKIIISPASSYGGR